MSFWTTIAPYAGMAAGAALGGPMGMAAGGAIGGAIAGESKRRDALARQERTAQAAADAGRVSWARRGGPGQIPGIQWASDTEREATMSGALAGGMQGYSFGQGMQNQGMFSKPSADMSQASSAMNNSIFGPGKMAPEMGSQFAGAEPSYGLNVQGVSQEAAKPSYGVGMDWQKVGYKPKSSFIY